MNNVIVNSSIQSASMLLDVKISLYTGRKTDKATATEVAVAKGAGSKHATTVHKHLFAGDTDLEAIGRHASACRQRIYTLTLPWSDSGTRLLPTKAFFSVSQELSTMRAEFDRLVQVFVDGYAAKVSNAAFALGQLFDRKQYPTPGEIQSRFNFSYTCSPVPDAGDFRVDIPAEAMQEVRAAFAKDAEERVRLAVGDAWTRIYDTAKTIRDKMLDPGEGKGKPRLHESTISGAQELCELLKGLNIFNDPRMEAMRRELEQVVDGADIKSLRESPELRDSVRSKMDSILAKF